MIFNKNDNKILKNIYMINAIDTNISINYY